MTNSQTTNDITNIIDRLSAALCPPPDNFGDSSSVEEWNAKISYIQKQLKAFYLQTLRSAGVLVK